MILPPLPPLVRPRRDGVRPISDIRWLIYPPEPLDDVIRGALLNALAFTDGNQSRAGKLLGISGRTMDYQMQRLGIPRAGRVTR